MSPELNAKLQSINIPPRPAARMKTIFEILADVDDRVKRSVLWGTVRSLNSMVIANVNVAVRRAVQREAQFKIDPRTSLDIRNEQDEAARKENVQHPESPYSSPYDGMTIDQIFAHGNGGELDENLKTAQQLHVLRCYLLDELIQLSITAPDMSYRNTLEFSTKREPRQKSSDEHLKLLAEIVDIPDVITVDGLRHMQIRNAARSNAQLAEATEAILRVTDCFGYEPLDEDGATEAFELLPLMKQLQVVQTIWRASVNAIQQALANDNMDTIADALMLKTVKEDLEFLQSQYKAQRDQQRAA